jgi:maltose alpha-D-glucosyltransferase / alpha-amylase
MTMGDPIDLQTAGLETSPDSQLPTPDSLTHTSDPYWYKDAIIYELHVKAFSDSNADGMGDFRGLIERLDYLQDLGVTCLWILPFFPSPLRDDGYDIASYHDVHPDYGSLADFEDFVVEAHRRGLRVITELVINHTSDQHPWFQEARKGPESPYFNHYVWSDTDQRYADARIIFTDTEHSNWTWESSARAYYWHRFFSHQPDLNFDNPDVCQAVLDTLRFWLDRGVDGLRLDAIPYLFEREGTNCENLPETHRYLKELRAAIDHQYQGRILLAEANQWPSDVRAYFGDSDECHLAFHFPLMPRMFMAIRREERRPITEILNQTPEIPPDCQWAIFLRNHDELTLEMVTDEERDYMYTEYARDPRMRVNIGIRRRLAPLISSCSTACSSPCRARRCSTTVTRSGWATTSTSATATASAPRCSGRRIAMPASRRPTLGGSTARQSWTRCTATRPSTSRPSSRRRLRSCSGSAA